MTAALLLFRNPARRASTEDTDPAWFARHPGRAYRVRSLTHAQVRQARCHHDAPPPTDTYGIAVRMIRPGLFHRRFVLGDTCDGSEDACRRVFDRALVAGEPPRSREPDELGGAA